MASYTVEKVARNWAGVEMVKVLEKQRSSGCIRTNQPTNHPTHSHAQRTIACAKSKNTTKVDNFCSFFDGFFLLQLSLLPGTHCQLQFDAMKSIPHNMLLLNQLLLPLLFLR